MSEERTSMIVEIDDIPQTEYGLLALPDTGLVGVIAAGHIVSTKKLKEVAYVKSDVLPPLVVVHEGEPKSPVRIFSNDTIIALVSETPLPSRTYRALSKEIAEWAKAKKVKTLISLSGIAAQNRLEIEKPEIFGIGGSAETRSFLKSHKIALLEEGFVAGPQAMLLNDCNEKGVPIAILLAQSHPQFPDPGAAVSMLNCLNESFGLNVDVKSLQEQAEEFRLRLRELMQRTQQSASVMEKSHEQEIPALYR